jgi:hypothetical protein
LLVIFRFDAGADFPDGFLTALLISKEAASIAMRL